MLFGEPRLEDDMTDQPQESSRPASSALSTCRITSEEGIYLNFDPENAAVAARFFEN
jgi:hypothetical protein